MTTERNVERRAAARGAIAEIGKDSAARGKSPAETIRVSAETRRGQLPTRRKHKIRPNARGVRL